MVISLPKFMEPSSPLLPVNELPEFPLWENGTPYALGTAAVDIPTLKPYLPDPAKATGAAIVVMEGWLPMKAKDTPGGSPKTGLPLSC